MVLTFLLLVVAVNGSKLSIKIRFDGARG